MRTSDKIWQCEKCWNYARHIDPENADELFSTVWLKIKEREIRDEDFDVDYYQTYFFQALRRTKHRQQEKSRKEIDLIIDPAETEDDYKWETELDVLNDWISKEPDDEYDQFLKNIITLVIHTNEIKDAAKLAGIPLPSFLVYYRDARKEIEYEHFKFIDTDTFYVLPLV